MASEERVESKIWNSYVLFRRGYLDCIDYLETLPESSHPGHRHMAEEVLETYAVIHGCAFVEEALSLWSAARWDWEDKAARDVSRPRGLGELIKVLSYDLKPDVDEEDLGLWDSLERLRRIRNVFVHTPRLRPKVSVSELLDETLPLLVWWLTLVWPKDDTLQQWPTTRGPAALQALQPRLRKHRVPQRRDIGRHADALEKSAAAADYDNDERIDDEPDK